MANHIPIFSDCGTCFGDGQVPVTIVGQDGRPEETGDTFDCPACGGSGKGAIGFLDSSVMEMLEDIKDKCDDILDKLNE